MNSDAERIIKEQTDGEDIRVLIQLMRQLNEQLGYLIEILE